jgi:hypothetical protein
MRQHPKRRTLLLRFPKGAHCSSSHLYPQVVHLRIAFLFSLLRRATQLRVVATYRGYFPLLGPYTCSYAPELLRHLTSSGIEVLVRCRKAGAWAVSRLKFKSRYFGAKTWNIHPPEIQLNFPLLALVSMSIISSCTAFIRHTYFHVLVEELME